MFWKNHHLWLRRGLLAANLLLPTCFFTCMALGWWKLFPFAISAAMLSHALLLVAIFHPRCPWLGPVIRSFRTTKNELWLTIDDGPDGDNTLRLAQALKARGVRATFFVIGQRAIREPDILREIIANGHTVGNHSLTHPRATTWCLSRARALSEITGGADALREHAPASALFRTPVGHKSPWLHPALRETGARLVAWTAGGCDGYRTNPSGLIGRILAKARPGAIILLHEHRPHSHTTILTVVDDLLSMGFQFTIPEVRDLQE